MITQDSFDTATSVAAEGLKAEITWRGLARSAPIAGKIQAQAAAIGRVYPVITRCYVVVGALAKTAKVSCGYEMRVKLEIPGDDIAIWRKLRTGNASTMLERAVHLTFRVAEQRLRKRLNLVQAADNENSRREQPISTDDQYAKSEQQKKN